MIYHITSKVEWETAQSAGHYTAPSLEIEGFIHNSSREQILKVANAFYRGQDNLVILCIDESKLKSKLVWEAPIHPNPDTDMEVKEAEQFAHIYGTLGSQAVVEVVPFSEGENGFTLPNNLP
jgi:uncharacterized protein (DUF952 family)